MKELVNNVDSCEEKELVEWEQVLHVLQKQRRRSDLRNHIVSHFQLANANVTKSDSNEMKYCKLKRMRK